MKSTASQCAKCGACAPVCPVFMVTGRESHTARGKLHLQSKLGPGPASKAYAEILSRCLLCGACEAVCSRRLDITSLVIEARRLHPGPAGLCSLKKSLVETILKRPGLLSGLAGTGARLNQALATLLPESSGLRLAPDLLGSFTPTTWPVTGQAPDRSQESHRNAAPTVAYFAGCLARYLDPAISRATGHVLGQAGQAMVTPAGQVCCGLAFRAAGKLEDALALARQNIAAFEGQAQPILTSCASCYSHLLTYPQLLAAEPEWHDRALIFAGRLREWSSYLVAETDISDQLTKAGSRVAADHGPLVYHDPCHLRFHCKITMPPRQLLSRLPGLDLRELADGPQCCGQGGLFGLLHPELSQAIFARLRTGLAQAGAGTVTTTCSGCLLKLRQGLAHGHRPPEVLHPAILLARALARVSQILAEKS